MLSQCFSWLILVETTILNVSNDTTKRCDMNVPKTVKKLLYITLKMSTAIAYSFMTMDNRRQADERSIVPRKFNNNSERYNNAGFDNSSDAGTFTRSGKRRPRKRSSSGSRTKKDARVSVYLSSRLHLRVDKKGFRNRQSNHIVFLSLFDKLTNNPFARTIT